MHPSACLGYHLEQIVALRYALDCDAHRNPTREIKQNGFRFLPFVELLDSRARTVRDDQSEARSIGRISKKFDRLESSLGKLIIFDYRPHC